MERITLASLDIDYQDVLKAMVETKKAIDTNKEITKELIEENKKLEAQGKKGSAQWEQNAKAIEVNGVSLKGLSAEYTANQKVMTANLFTKDAELGTLEKLANRNKELRIALRGLNLETEEGKKKQKEYIGEIDNNTKFIKENTDAQTKQFMNVGNYGSALQGLPEPLGKATAGVKGFSKQLLALLANPIVAIIAAIVGAFMLLVKAFKTNEEASEKFKTIMSGITAVFTEILGRIVSLGQALIKVFKGDFKGAAEEAKAAFVGLRDAIQENFKNGTEEAKLQRKIRNDEIALLETIAKRNKEIAEIKKQSADKSIDAAKREAGERKAEELSIANLKDQLALQGERVRLAEMEMENTHVNQRSEEQRRKIAEERAKLYELETSSLNEQAGIVARRVEAERTRAAEEKARADERIAAINEEIRLQDEAMIREMEREDAIAKKRALEIEKAKEEAIALEQWEYERKILNAQNDLALREAQNEDIFSLDRARLQMQYEMEIRAAEETGADVALINKKYKAFNEALAKEEQNAKLSAYRGFAGDVANLFGKNTAVGRAAAVAQTSIATYQSATESYKAMSGIPVVGPALGFAAAGVAVAAGLVNVKKILSTKSGLPGDSGGGGGGISGSVPGAGAVSAFRPSPTTGSNYYDSVGVMKDAIENIQPVMILEDFQKANQRAIAPKQAALL